MAWHRAWVRLGISRSSHLSRMAGRRDVGKRESRQAMNLSQMTKSNRSPVLHEFWVEDEANRLTLSCTCSSEWAPV
ncbi:hypothetical protein Y1Q_0023812 [Alligator mississippiensis]|uniref:Uncharacterized protein n=1 Tax=Alligator mississippiensis TaxID=8496 RepID=A0A151MK95_ALLMI|nr:hypothetical protein Y1Q_0023812 [Alligator mississippiensis]